MADPLDRLGGESGGGFRTPAILNALRKRKWHILGVTILVAGLVGFVVSKQPKIYRASTSMVFDTSVPQYMGSNFKEVVEVDPSWWSSRETMETEFRILRSHSQGVAVAKALCARKFGPDGGPALRFLLPNATCADPAEHEKASPLVQGMLSVEPIANTRLVNLTVTSHSPEFAVLLANTAAQVYVDRNLEKRLSHSAGAATWLEGEYGDLVGQLRKAEQELVEFKKRNNIVAVSLEDDQNELSSKRQKLAEELTTLEVKLIGLRSQREQLQAAKRADPITELEPVLAQSPVAQKLKELYTDQYGKLIELKGKYLERHPALVAQESRLAVLRQDLTREIELAHKGVEFEFQRLNRQAGDLRVGLDVATKAALALETRASEYNRLRREMDRLLRLTDQVGGREQETALVSHLKTNNVRILDLAIVPTVPIAPDVPRAVGMAAAIALLLALGLAVLIEVLDNTLKSQEDVEGAIGVTFLGLIPRISEKDKGPKPANGHPQPPSPDGAPRELYVLNNPHSTVAECCRSIRTNLLFMSPDKPARKLLVTSAGPQEGKTTVAVNLAITLAQSGLRVLLVDTDMRRPRLHKVLGVPSNTDGISKAIVGGCDVMDVTRQTEIENLWLLPCGACPPNPAELLHAERFLGIVEKLAANFDRVIFDSPPIGVVTDAAILARITDGTVLIAKSGRTTREALVRARRALDSDGSVNILGCILNDIDLSKRGRYGYYYYYYARYGQGYYAARDTATPGSTPASS